jgi:ATP-dependent DNA ligase
MEATSVGELPVGPEWHYEPKWDGFRAVVFRDDDTVELQSKSCKPLTRYFPELVAALLRLKARRFVIDGEIIIPLAGAFSFDALLQRIHPAASRIKKLSGETPARLIVFDLLVDERGRDLSKEPLARRRERLEAFARQYFPKKSPLALSPATARKSTIARWAKRAGNSLDGIIAKRDDLDYRSGLRDGMVKFKKAKTADCVVGGFRYSSQGKRVGSLLLGLFNEQGLLDHVGFIAVSKSMGTPELTHKLEKLIAPPGFTGDAPGGPSRWSTARSTKWEPLRNKLVVEVQYDHFTGGRFRHGTKFLRWRPDKSPRQCTIKQVRQESGLPLLLL